MNFKEKLQSIYTAPSEEEILDMQDFLHRHVEYCFKEGVDSRRILISSEEFMRNDIDSKKFIKYLEQEDIEHEVGRTNALSKIENVVIDLEV